MAGGLEKKGYVTCILLFYVRFWLWSRNPALFCYSASRDLSWITFPRKVMMTFVQFSLNW